MPLEQRHFEDLTRDQQLFQLAKALNPSFAMEQRHFESLTRDQQLFQIYGAVAAAGGGSTTLDPVDSLQIFGSGADGDLNGGLAGAGIITVGTDMFWNKVTLGPGDALQMNGWRIHIKTLDLTNASASALRWCPIGGLDGVAPVGGVGGAIPSYAPTAGTLGNGTRGLGGKNSVSGTAVAGSIGATVSLGAGGAGGASGAGGAGNSGAVPGGAGAAGGPISGKLIIKTIESTFMRGSTAVGGGASGGTGASGGGAGAMPSGASASSASGGGFGALYVENIITGPATPALCFDFRGGSVPPSGNGASGGGSSGGSGGGGGGAIYMVYSKHTGAPVPNFFDVSGGNGGNGGALVSTGAIGIGGQGGNGGSIVLINALTGVVTLVDNTAVAAAVPALMAGSQGIASKMNLP